MYTFYFDTLENEKRRKICSDYVIYVWNCTTLSRIKRSLFRTDVKITYQKHGWKRNECK